MVGVKDGVLYEGSEVEDQKACLTEESLIGKKARRGDIIVIVPNGWKSLSSCEGNAQSLKTNATSSLSFSPRADGKLCGNDANHDGCERTESAQDVPRSRVLIAVAFTSGARRLRAVRCATGGSSRARGGGGIWVRGSEWFDFERFRRNIDL
jgi:hypothetical protein